MVCDYSVEVIHKNFPRMLRTVIQILFLECYLEFLVAITKKSYHHKLNLKMRTICDKFLLDSRILCENLQIKLIRLGLFLLDKKICLYIFIRGYCRVF